MITIYSLFWTIFNCSIMALIIFVLRTRTSFITKYGTPILYFLIICCIIRVLFPVEFPDFQYVIADSSVYSMIFNKFKFVLHPDFMNNALPLVIILWIIGSIFSAFRLFKQLRNVQKHINFVSCKNCSQASEILKRIDSSCHLPVRICPRISVPILAGYLHPAIYLPDNTYTDTDLHYIILHEYMHWKRKDIWRKLLINIICVIFWWNPAVYPIRKEIIQLIEFRCDKQLARNLSDVDIVDYLVTLRSCFERVHQSKVRTSLYTIEFVNTAKKHTIIQRFDLLLTIHVKTNRRRLLSQFLIILATLVWMISSYFFILQTKYETPYESLRSETPTDDKITSIADEQNAYLQEQANGSYIFHYNGLSIDIPSSEVEAGLYDFYPIIEYQNENKTFIEKIIFLFKNFLNLTY